ncbi:hypothetical protein CL628_03130 [bacterium]|nr:hypothetical protein [bacterium]
MCEGFVRHAAEFNTELHATLPYVSITTAGYPARDLAMPEVKIANSTEEGEARLEELQMILHQTRDDCARVYVGLRR